MDGPAGVDDGWMVQQVWSEPHRPWSGGGKVVFGMVQEASGTCWNGVGGDVVFIVEASSCWEGAGGEGVSDGVFGQARFFYGAVS